MSGNSAKGHPPSLVGQRVASVDGPEKITGRALYLGDLDLPGMLHGRILRSPIAHGLITSIDTSRAAALAGVRAVITAADTPGVRFGGMEDTKDQYVLAAGKVRFIGDEVAAVAAETEELAEEALSLIRVEYEELPAVFSLDEALAEGAPLVHDHAEGNIAVRISRHFGDVDEGFRGCDFIAEDTFETPAVTPACLEPRGCLAEVDPSGRIKVYSTNQTPHLMPSRLAEALAIESHRFRVIQAYSGGAFGSKIFIDPIDPICVLLALKSGRPVRLMMSRAEDFVATRMRHPMRITLKTGVTRDGLIQAREVKAWSNNGAYSSFGKAVLNVALGVPSLMYRIPNLRLDGSLVYTNNPYPGAFQGFGNPQGTFATESQMDIIAAALGLDPLELRLRNSVEADWVSCSDTRIVSCGICECADRATDEAGWDEKRGGKGNRGLGLAFMVHPNSSRGLVGTNFADCLIKIHPDGTVHLISGAVDIGQGSATVLAQIAAEQIGVQMEKIRVVPVDTDVSPPDTGTHATRVTLVAGNAVKIAADAARAELINLAAANLRIDPARLKAAGGRVFAEDDPDRGVAIEELARQSYFTTGRPIITRGSFQPETDFDPATGRGNYSPTFSFACQIAEVEVDRETGQVRVLSFTAAHDVGRAINPQKIESQIEGGILKGIGFALTEELVWDHGRTSNPSYRDYHCPTFADMPQVKTILVETHDPVGPLGAKGVAEPALVPTAPAVANAIYDAVGVRMKRLPITPERLLAALRAQASKEPGPNHKA